MTDPSLSPLDATEKAFENFDKWKTYGLVFGLMDKRKITLRQIVEIAGRHGINEGVLRMRRLQFLAMRRS